MNRIMLIKKAIKDSFEAVGIWEFFFRYYNMLAKYRKAHKKKLNSTKLQKQHWEDDLINYKKSGKDPSLYGYSWGDPDSPDNLQSQLGDYLSIKQKLMSKITDNTVVLEIGTLGGKWTRYMSHAKKIICVDINEYFITYVKQLFPEATILKMDFYVCEGNELNGVSNSSVDLIFTMDTLVRVEKEYIYDYFKEMHRVLKKGGEIIAHLPNNDLPGSASRWFTLMRTEEIQRLAENYFCEFTIDSETINHGSILYAKK